MKLISLSITLLTLGILDAPALFAFDAANAGNQQEAEENDEPKCTKSQDIEGSGDGIGGNVASNANLAKHWAKKRAERDACDTAKGDAKGSKSCEEGCTAKYAFNKCDHGSDGDGNPETESESTTTVDHSGVYSDDPEGWETAFDLGGQSWKNKNEQPYFATASSSATVKGTLYCIPTNSDEAEDEIVGDYFNHY